MILSSHVGGVI